VLSRRSAIETGQAFQPSRRWGKLHRMATDCIWGCGRPADSNEDVLAEWIREYLGAKQGRKKWELRDLSPPHRPSVNNPRPGRGQGFRVRADNIVCETCNNGWMSVLQNESKPLLLQMFDGEPLSLMPTAQDALLRWSTMTSICHQYASGETVETYRRTFFYEHRTPPPHTEVHLAHLPTPDMDTVFSAARYRSKYDQKPFVYIDVFSVRQLAMLILQGQLPPWSRNILDQSAGSLLSLRSPVSMAPQPWPPSPSTSDDLYALADALLVKPSTDR